MNAAVKEERFSIKDTIVALWLYTASKEETNPKALYDLYTTEFEHSKGSYDYIARIAKELEAKGYLALNMDKHMKFYRTTSEGKKALHSMTVQYETLFTELQIVLNRISDMLSNHTGSVLLAENELPAALRTYFSKLISVKDLVRYMVFYIGSNRTEFYAAEVNEQLKLRFGWHVSNGYLYDIVREMETDGTIKGRWEDTEKRTKRLIQVTDEGMIFKKRVTADLFTQVKNVQKYITSMLKFIKS